MKRISIIFFVLYNFSFSIENNDYILSETKLNFNLKNFYEKINKSFEYQNKSLIDYKCYSADGSIFKLNSDYVNFTYFDYNLDLDKIISNPKGTKFGITSKYYDLNIINLDLNIDEFEWKIFDNISQDQLFYFQNNTFNYTEHTFKLPYKEYEVDFSFGESSEKNYQFKTSEFKRYLVEDRTLDINLEDIAIKSNKISFKYKNKSIGYSKYDLNGNITVNYSEKDNNIDQEDIKDAGNIDGYFKNYYIKMNNFKFSYNNLFIDTNAYINEDNLWLVVMGAHNQEVYLNLKADLDIYNLEYEYIKDFNKSSLRISSNIGFIKNNDLYFTTKKINYEKSNLIKVSYTKYKTTSINESNIYYAIFNINYEKYWGDFTLGINKIIPLVTGIDFKTNEYTISGNTTNNSIISKSTISNSSISPITSSNDNDEEDRKDLIKGALLSGLSLYFRYDF